MQVSIGAVTPPEQVLTETKNTAAQNQNICTQKATANTELSPKQAEINLVIADMACQKEMKMPIDKYPPVPVGNRKDKSRTDKRQQRCHHHFWR